MDTPATDFVRAGSLEELKAKGRLVAHGRHRPILVVHDKGRVFALDNRCPHMGFPLDRGSVEDGTLTCHWHHARFDLASGCTFDLWADDVPTCPAELRDGEVWVRPAFGYADPAAHWCQRLDDGLGHVLGLVIAKAVYGQLAAGVPPPDFVRQVALFGIQNRDGWGVGLTIPAALGNLLPVLPEEESVALLEAFDRQRQVDLAARLVARHLTLGHSVQALIVTLARALLREDAGFHAYQALDAGVRQFGEWGNTDEGRHILIAVARYLAAHSPTERAELQTAEIARRLMRGGELHREATA